MYNILIVDDSIDLLNFFSLLLLMKGYQVQTALSKDKMEREISLLVPDIIFLDIKLNGESGADLCEEIKLRKFDTKPPAIILISASPDLLNDYQHYYVDDIIEKPFDLLTVIKTINKVLNTIPEKQIQKNGLAEFTSKI